MKILPFIIASIAVLGFNARSVLAQEQTPEQKARIEQLISIQKALTPKYDTVSIPLADVTLQLGKDYYFLNTEDSKKVIVDGWKNPPDNAKNVLGMIFKDKTNFINAQWGAIITYKPVGYVPDEDSKTADYDALLKQMREGEDQENTDRVKQGYEPIHIVGWAQPPSYDPAHHTLIWAQNLHFGNQTDNTLNYDVRILGRRGLLSLNMVSTMSQLPDVGTAAASLASLASYKPGARYEDFSPSTDVKAEYGLAGVVAAGLGVAVAKKLGFLALLLAFGKKFFIIILVALGGAFGYVKRLFASKS
ncbi:DUF2167 domain-containing protein [Labrys neptuniae]